MKLADECINEDNGKYLSKRGRGFLSDFVELQFNEPYWDKVCLMADLNNTDEWGYLDMHFNDDDLANLMGDEGMHNLDNMMDGQKNM